MMTVNEAIEKITSAKAGETVYIKISKSLLTGDALTDLAALLGYTTTTTEIAEGIYPIDNGKDGIAYINFSYEDASIEIDIEIASDNSEVKLTDLGWTWKYSGDSPSVDWGNGKGAIEIKNLEHISNIYATAGKYTIRITDLCISDTFSESATGATPFGNRPTYMPAVAIRFNKEQVINSAFSLFRNFRILKSIAGIVRINPASTSLSFNQTFRLCYELEDISKLTIIANNPTTNISAPKMFQNCYKITADNIEKMVIKNLDIDLIRDYTAIFEHCTSLKRIPRNLIGAGFTEPDYAFGDTAIEYIPANIFDNVEKCNNTFTGTNIKYISTEANFGKLFYIRGTLADSSLVYKSIETLYNSLQPAQEINNDNYVIVFGFDETEKNIVKRLHKLFNINPEEVSDADRGHWTKDGVLMTDGSGEPIVLPHPTHGWNRNNSKGWGVAFTSQSAPW